MASTRGLRIILTPVLRSKAKNSKIPERAGWTLHACGSKARDQESDDGALSRAFHRMANLVNTQWDQSSKADPGSLRGKVYYYGQKLLSRLPTEEYFLRELNALETNKPTFVFPAKIDTDDAIQYIKELTSEQRKLHQKYLNGSIVLVPFSLLFSLVPLLPNFPLMWNLFRLYCHLSALRGARHIQDLLLSEQIQASPDEGMQKFLDDASHMESASGIEYISEEAQNELGELLNAPDLPKTLQRAVGQLGRQYGVPAAAKRLDASAENR
eukprot:Plantae.Rhodophyta-Purpureofilum_apyrenoidigerum.ctg12933.p1 GENE.Plantae.Rhodophyta-Purpureofilum_apyrenoidigerum.ctg12933~~Plantae.Rhodophyta-Purpureofilum_apyrenoidigerum.ctg12933.p1  ORF type:complete len:269 (+),score=47.72 Plantae.Rhodophyta-Purpureofilum_apyrenoidigerum.ctg12933:1049-1855(+)